MNGYSNRKLPTAAKWITEIIKRTCKNPGVLNSCFTKFLQPENSIQKHEKLKTVKKELIRDIFNLLN